MIDELKLDHVNLIGNDLGADVALYYAVEHPDKVERMVLVSGGLVGARGAEKLRKGMLPTTPDAIRAQVEASFFDLPPMPDFIYQRMMVATEQRPSGRDRHDQFRAPRRGAHPLQNRPGLQHAHDHNVGREKSVLLEPPKAKRCTLRCPVRPR